MSRDQVVAALVARAQDDARIEALLLGGSLGSGKGDAFSDADLILVAAPAHHAAVVAEARDWAAAAGDIVWFRSPYPGLPLFCAITREWVRFDLTITVPGQVTGSQAGLKPLVDRGGVWAALPERLPPRPITPERLEGMIQETLRIVGLLPVAIGRGEYALGVTGAGLLRDLLISLMIAETEPPLPPGALHLSRLLPPQDLEIIGTRPGVAAAREAVIAASLDYARLFLPRARRLAEQVGAAWPEDFEAATRDHLRRTLDVELPASRD